MDTESITRYSIFGIIVQYQINNLRGSRYTKLFFDHHGFKLEIINRKISGKMNKETKTTFEKQNNPLFIFMSQC